MCHVCLQYACSFIPCTSTACNVRISPSPAGSTSRRGRKLLEVLQVSHPKPTSIHTANSCLRSFPCSIPGCRHFTVQFQAPGIFQFAVLSLVSGNCRIRISSHFLMNIPVSSHHLIPAHLSSNFNFQSYCRSICQSFHISNSSSQSFSNFRS